MTDIDLDAIRARYEAARLPYSAAYHVGDIHPAYNDVPALLARLAEVEADRDAYWRRFNSSQDSNKTLAGQVHDLAAENARLRQQTQRDDKTIGDLGRELVAANDALADVTRLLDEAREERDEWKSGMERALKDREAVEAEIDDRVIALARQRDALADRAEQLAAENARLRHERAAIDLVGCGNFYAEQNAAMRPVVEAAKAWRAWWGRLRTSIIFTRENELANAVDAYRAARPGETPGALVPGEDDITAEPDAYRAGQKAPATGLNATEADQ